MTIYRDRHWTDIEVEGPGRSRRRRVGNHINYRTPGGLILPAQVNVAAQGPPADWVGQWDFRDFSGESALQFAAHDTTDPDNRAMVGLRIDDTPDVWTNYKAMDVVTGIETVSPDSQTREWPGLWANSTLRWTHGVSVIQKEIVLSAAGHPASFRFSAKTSPGSSWEVSDGVLIVRQGGVEKMRTQDAYGKDANGDHIRATLTLDDTWGPGGAYPILRITPNADDMAGAVYPVVIDPTTTISGDSGIDDTILDNSAGDMDDNYGTSQSEVAASIFSSISRIDETLIPAGTITLFEQKSVVSGTRTYDFNVYKIAAANAGWVEGTKNGAIEAGSPCWNYHAYNTVNWAGAAGCSVSGTDFVADASPPNITGTSVPDGTIVTMTYPNAWATDWRDNPGNNAGRTWIYNSGTASFVASVSGTRPGDVTYYEVTYTAPATGQPAYIRWTPTHVAGRNRIFGSRF